MFPYIWVLSLCLLWNYTNCSAFIFNASLLEQQPQEVWFWSKVKLVPVLPNSVPLSKSQVWPPFTGDWDTPGCRTGLFVVALLCRRTHRHRWSSARMFGVRRARLRHSRLNLFCKASTMAWTFVIFRDVSKYLNFSVFWRGSEGRKKASQIPKALAQWRRPEGDGVG